MRKGEGGNDSERQQRRRAKHTTAAGDRQTGPSGYTSSLLKRRCLLRLIHSSRRGRPRPSCDYYLVWRALRLMLFRLLRFQVCCHLKGAGTASSASRFWTSVPNSSMHPSFQSYLWKAAAAAGCSLKLKTMRRAGAQPPASVGAFQPAAQ